ncbi:MAG: SpoVG family protein [Planctomycetaceae bacterium]|nr:SpoVG family protein [Planctomycetaceae bacterium]
MEITRVTVEPAADGSRVLAYASIEFDAAFVIHDLKVVRHPDGRLFVAMPARQIADRCPACCWKTPLTAAFCSHCGTELPEQPDADDSRLFADIAHPINAKCRQMIEDAVIQQTVRLARNPVRA